MVNKKLKLINELKNRDDLNDLKEINDLIQHLNEIKEKIDKLSLKSYKLSRKIKNKESNLITDRQLSMVTTRFDAITKQIKQIKKTKHTFEEPCEACKTLTKINKLKEKDNKFYCNICYKK